MDYPRSYRLPDGESTQDVNVYLATWDVLAAKVTSFFPGYIESSRDPGMTFTRWSKNRFGRDVAEDRIDLSVAAINALTAPRAPSGSRDY